MSIPDSQLNVPDVVQEITAIFERYEAAFMANDLEALNGFFWQNPSVTRYGIADQQSGHEALVAYRASMPAPDFTRSLHNVRITAFGADTAVAMCEFVRSDTVLRGYQTQTWVRFEEGWRIVSAHVSMIPAPIPLC